MSIRDTLDRIERKANWLRKDASDVAEYVGQLAAQRGFETMAQDAMKRAELELVTALATVRAAQKKFAALPVNNKAA